MKKAVICFITDNGYIVPTTVAITSLIANKHSDSLYQIFILAKDLSVENQTVLQKFNQSDVQLQIIKTQPEQAYVGVTSNNTHVSATALYKFSLADLFSTYDKLLYLDGDVLVRQDLSDFYAINLMGTYAAVVKDYRAIVSKPNPMEFLPVKHRAYFNSGVMLLNLKLMREHGLKNKLIDYRLHGINHFMDQDTLNVVFDENVIYLPITYNGMYSTLTHFSAEDICTYYSMEPQTSVDKICDSCQILHLCSPTKPWNYLDSWHAKEWYFYYKKSPFHKKPLYRTYFYPPKNTKDKFKHKLANLWRRLHTDIIHNI